MFNQRKASPLKLHTSFSITLCHDSCSQGLLTVENSRCLRHTQVHPRQTRRARRCSSPFSLRTCVPFFKSIYKARFLVWRSSRSAKMAQTIKRVAYTPMAMHRRIAPEGVTYASSPDKSRQRNTQENKVDLGERMQPKRMRAHTQPGSILWRKV